MEDRIRELMEYKGLTSTQLADTIEVPRATVSHILSGRNKASLDVVIKILDTFRDIAMSWLLLGEGKMLKGLVSEVKASAKAKQAVEQAPIPPEEAPQVGQVKEKVQDLPPTAPVPAAPEKVVEQVMVFYTDKTFSTYKPS